MDKITKFLKRPLAIVAATLLGAAIIVSGYYLGELKTKRNNQDPLRYQALITAEARKSLPIPESAIQRGRAVLVPILMYHHVGDYPPGADATRRGLTVATADFKQQVEWLKTQGYTSIKLTDLAAAAAGNFPIPKKAVIFTFDDGYSDVFLNALPILKQNGFTGSFAIITDYPKSQAFDQQADNFYASWQQIAEAYQSGSEIVSHTQNHFNGKSPQYTANFIYNNLAGSIKDIQNHLGFKTDILVYPYGAYTPMYIEQAKKAGFTMGVTLHEGRYINLDDLMQVPRVRVSGGESLKKFAKALGFSLATSTPPSDIGHQN